MDLSPQYLHTAEVLEQISIRCPQSPPERAEFLQAATVTHIKYQCKEYGYLTLPFRKFYENLLGNEGLMQPSIKQTALGNRISHGKILLQEDFCL